MWGGCASHDATPRSSVVEARATGVAALVYFSHSIGLGSVSHSIVSGYVSHSFVLGYVSHPIDWGYLSHSIVLGYVSRSCVLGICFVPPAPGRV